MRRVLDWVAFGIWIGAIATAAALGYYVGQVSRDPIITPDKEPRLAYAEGYAAGWEARDLRGCDPGPMPKDCSTPAECEGR